MKNGSKLGLGLLILNRCIFFQLDLLVVNQTKRKRYESCNLSSQTFKYLTFYNADFVTIYSLNFFLRDFSDAVVLEHSKLMQLFNNMPSTIASEGQWPHPIAKPTIYRSERNLKIKTASSYWITEARANKVSSRKGSVVKKPRPIFYGRCIRPFDAYETAWHLKLPLATLNLLLLFYTTWRLASFFSRDGKWRSFL